MTGSASILLLGTVAEEPEQLQTKTGKLWLKLLIEVKNWKRASDGEAGQEEVTWIPVNLFSRVAEIARAYLKAGDAVGLTCRLAGTEFKAANGPVRRGVTVTADQLHLIPNGRSRSDSQRPTEQREGVML